MSTIRLNKLLAEAGAASRRKADALIAAGRVTVNGAVVSTPGAKADPARDRVCVDGRPLAAPRERALVYLMLHKPEGVVTTVSDPQGRPTVMDLLPELAARVYPVGRLDYDSSGLLLLTNDGALTQRLTHPRAGVRKTYRARVRGVPQAAACRAFAGGLYIGGRRTAPCRFRVVKNEGETALVEIQLSEGRNRQVRKMCEAIGHPVLSLKRTAVGPLALGGLPRGAWRRLTPEEARGLLEAGRGGKDGA